MCRGRVRQESSTSRSDDPAVAAAGGPAELPALAALLGLGLAEPARPRGPQLPAVGPEVRPGAGVLAELAQPAVLPAARAALPGRVRLRQLVLPVAAASTRARIRASVYSAREWPGLSFGKGMFYPRRTDLDGTLASVFRYRMTRRTVTLC